MPGPASSPASLWAAITLLQPDLDAVLRRHPNPQAPLALVHGPAQQRRLLAVNLTALRLGLQTGQSLATAQALAPECRFVPRQPADTRRLMHWLAGWAGRYSPLVSTQWPDSLLLEVGSSLRLHGGWPRLQQQLRSDLQALQLQHQLALAPSPRAAWVLAGWQDGLHIWQTGQLLPALQTLPLALARLPGDAATRLQAMGLRQLQQLLALPRAGLQQRFGPALLLHLDRLLGQAPDPVQAHPRPRRLVLRLELDWHSDNLQALLFPLRRLLGDLEAFLRGQASGVQQLSLQLEHAQSPATVLRLQLLAPERQATALLHLLQTRLQATSLPEPVTALALRAPRLLPWTPGSGQLLAPRGEQALPWEQLRERLRAQLGDQALWQLQESGDPRPEHAWQIRSPSDPDPATRPARSMQPAWLLHSPQPLAGPPRRILAGPQRLESGWWDGHEARRDYYVLETGSGQLAWAFLPTGLDPLTHPGTPPWMLHGWLA